MEHDLAVPVRTGHRLTTGLTAITDSVYWLFCRASTLLFIAILVIMLLQVVYRYVLNEPLAWSEELARYLFIWACWCGAPVAMRRGTHVVISILSERLPARAAKATALGTHVISLLFLLELVHQGILLTIRGHSLSAITLAIPWSAIYLAAPLSAGAMILMIVGAIVKTLTGSDKEVQR